MIFQILDRQFNTLATMDNSLAGAIHFFNDEFHQYLAEGSSTFDFSVLRNHADTQFLVEGNYVHFTYKSRDYLMTLRRIVADEYKLDITCEDLCFDLINEYVAAYKAPKARKITEYLGDILVDSDVVIGLNEVASYSRTLEWTGESTVLERVLSIANYFDAEVEFITELENDRSLKQITLNIYHKYDDTHQGVGVNRTDIELRFGENVKTVRKTSDITELYTCIKPEGKDGLTIKDVEETITDAGGNVLYYTKKGSLYIYAPQSNNRFGRKGSEKGGYINMPYEYDTDSVATLYGNALSQLKKYSEPAVTYEVEGYYDLNVGDVVSIADNGYSPILLLEARVSEMITSFANPENNKTVFSNYRVFDSQISSDLLEMMQQMKDDVAYAVQVANTPIFKISVSGSTVFKNGEGSVELQAAIERANTDITDEYSVFNWKKQNKDGSVDQAWTDDHKNYGKKITITPEDFSDAAVFSYEVETEGKVFLGGAASVVKVYDGENGKTPIKGVDYFDGQDGTDGRSAYLHIRYSQNANGSPMTEDPVNAKYVGLQVSQSPTASTNPADYDWSLVKGADGIPGETGADGKTSYLHIKYSDDGGQSFTDNSGEAVGSWLGQYVDFEPADSVDVTSYAWSKIEGQDGKTSYIHIAYANSVDGTLDFSLTEADGKKYIGQYTDFSDVASEDPSVYQWARVKGEDGNGIASTAVTYLAGISGTVVPEGNWSTTVPSVDSDKFLWTKTVINYTDYTSSTAYSVSKMGASGEDGAAGVSVVSVEEEYYVSTSPDSQTGGSWSTTVPNNADPNLYVWRRMKNTMSDSTVTYTNPALIQGMTGIYPYIGPTQPANPKEGQQWWKSDSNGNVTDFYVYHDGSWQGQTIQQSILNIVALNAVAITGSTITGTVINGSKFTNTTSYSETGGLVDYTTTIEGNITMDWKAQNSEANGLFTIMPTIMQNDFYGDTAKKNRIGTWTLGSSGLIVGQGNAGASSFKGAAIGPNGLGMTDPKYTPTYGEVALTYQDLLTLPMVGIPAASGWTQYATSGNARPTATRNGRIVQLAGAFKNNSDIAAGAAEVVMGTLPVGYRPAATCNFIVQASVERIYLLTIYTDGSLTLERHRGWDGSKFGYYKVPAGSWLNIACNFAAGDI